MLKPAPVAPSIRVYQPLLITQDHSQTYQKQVQGYRQTVRLLGGYWQARWNLDLMPTEQQKAFFNRRMGSHIRVYDGGGLIWLGFIWEMEMYSKGVLRRISLDKVRNAVKCIYTDQDDEARAETSYYENTGSIQRYGRIEEIVYLDKVWPATAEKYAQTILKEQQFPIPRIVSVRAPEDNEISQLRVTAVGYSHTLNYQYLTISDITRNIGGTAGGISVALDTDNEFINEGSIAPNGTFIRPPDTETRVWDWFMELTEIGDGITPYTIQVWDGRRLIYKPLDPNPTLYWDGINIRSGTSKSTSVNKYSARPGVLRDLTWTSSKLPSDSFLLDKRDSIVSEIESGMNYHVPILKADDYNDSDLMASLIAAEAELEARNAADEENND